MSNQNIIELKNINMTFNPKKKNEAKVLRDINLTIKSGESIAIVGESGCGKTTLGKIIVDTLKATSGDYYYHGKKVKDLKGSEYKKFRLDVQLVQQDSFAALNPNKTIKNILSYALIEHKIVEKTEVENKVRELLSDVGLTPVEQFIDKYPHQLSGGQRQRILIARAISVNPKVIVADEPVSMVDVSLRISLLTLMRNISEKYNVSYVYITHDIATARYISDRGKIILMYLGEIFEEEDIKFNPYEVMHPYFKALIAAVPDIKKKQSFDDFPLKSMTMPSIMEIPPGCTFEPRCIYATEDCKTNKQELQTTSSGCVRCQHYQSINKQ